MPEVINPTIELPLYILLVLLCLLAGCFVLAMKAVKNMAAALQEQPDAMLPLVDATKPGTTPLHRWDARFKIAAIIGFAFLTVSLHRSLYIGAALLVAAGLVSLARLSWSRSLRRIMAMNGFLAMFLVVMPFTAIIHPDDTLIQFGALSSWPLNLRGLELAVQIVGKAWTVALLMEPLLATAPLGSTLAGLTRLGVPDKVAELLLIAHRYIHVFFGELQRMRCGMEARAFRSGFRLGALRDYGNFVGMLLVRSFERTHRVYDAMQARGYAGLMPQQEVGKAKAADWLKMILLVVVGLILLIGDRLAGGAA
ncbi:MAG: cobalt ECF transporter T component CbiQ [Desulfuromonas sp.]|nr:MAG: cobalt ECF transporter T component CbiQ [Desulfuromonas sp.]